jgi:hypothetical protein
LTSPGEDFQAFLREYPTGTALREISSPAIVEALRPWLENDLELRQKRSRGIEFHEKQLNYEHQFKPILEAFRKALPLSDSEAESASPRQSERR